MHAHVISRSQRRRGFGFRRGGAAEDRRRHRRVADRDECARMGGRRGAYAGRHPRSGACDVLATRRHGTGFLSMAESTRGGNPRRGSCEGVRPGTRPRRRQAYRSTHRGQCWSTQQGCGPAGGRITGSRTLQGVRARFGQRGLCTSCSVSSGHHRAEDGPYGKAADSNWRSSVGGGRL